MKELQSIFETYERSRAAGQDCFLATVTSVRGSSYRRPGARLLITAQGEMVGCVSGGCLERDLLRRTSQINETGLLLRYDTHAEGPLTNSIEVVSLGCGGVIEVWLERLPANRRHPVLSLLADWKERRVEGTVALITEYEAGPNQIRAGSFLASENGKLSGDVECSEARETLAFELLRASKPQGMELTLNQFKFRSLIEPFIPPLSWNIFGAGLDAIPMAKLAFEMGWEVSVFDTRGSYPAPAGAFGFVKKYLRCAPHELEELVTLPKTACAIVMTHNYSHDLEITGFLLKHSIHYLGLLGPKKRGSKVVEDLRGRGELLSKQALSNFHSPAGIAIGAETPQEIALSVIAEVQAWISDLPTDSLRDRQGPIHDSCFA